MDHSRVEQPEGGDAGGGGRLRVDRESRKLNRLFHPLAILAPLSTSSPRTSAYAPRRTGERSAGSARTPSRSAAGAPAHAPPACWTRAGTRRAVLVCTANAVRSVPNGPASVRSAMRGVASPSRSASVTTAVSSSTSYTTRSPSRRRTFTVLTCRMGNDSSSMMLSSQSCSIRLARACSVTRPSSSCGFARQNRCTTLWRAAAKAARDSGFRAGSAVHRSSGSWRTTLWGPSSIQWGRVRATGSTGPRTVGDCWACDGSDDGRERAAYCRSRVATPCGSAFRMPAARPRSWVVRTATAQDT